MLLGNSLSNICSSPGPKKEITKFKFPTPRKSNQNEDPQSSNKADDAAEGDVKKRTSPTPGYEGLRNLFLMMMTMILVKLMIGCCINVPSSISLPPWRQVLPSRLPLPNLIVLVFPFIANLGKIFKVLIF